MNNAGGDFLTTNQTTQGPQRNVDIYSAVPQELKELHQWVIWLNHWKDGDDKPSKILYQTNGWAASTTSKRNWKDYHTIATFYCQIQGKPFDYRYRPHKGAPYEYHTGKVEGIGLVFTKSDPYCGIDLDNCLYRDENGKIAIKTWAQMMVERLTPMAYAEVSPSGNGIKFWTRASLPAGARNKVYLDEPAGEAIEAYDCQRFFTITGKGKGAIGDGQEVLDWIFEQYLKPEPEANISTTNHTTQKNVSSSANLHTAEEVIASIQKSKQCHKFNALMVGNTTGYGSHSEADYALCCLIAFWTQKPTIIDAIFRKSQLIRPKWDEVHKGDKVTTYGEHTIQKAVAGTRQTYQPKRKQFSRTKTTASQEPFSVWRLPMILDTDQERKDLAEKRLADATQQYQQAKAADEDTEALENRLNEIDILQRFIEQSQRTQPKLEEAPSLDDVEKYQTEFLIDNWMPADRLTLLTGPGGTGKSYLALQHIVGLALGVSNYQFTQIHKLPEVLEDAPKHEALTANGQ